MSLCYPHNTKKQNKSPHVQHGTWGFNSTLLNICTRNHTNIYLNQVYNSISTNLGYS